MINKKSKIFVAGHKGMVGSAVVRKLKEIPYNVRISGDWTQTTHPCTIEGSILSGKLAILQ